MPSTMARMRLALEIQSASGAGGGKGPYKKRAPADQHVAKMGLLEELSSQAILDCLSPWLSLLITVDVDQQDSLPSVPVLIQQQFDAVKANLEAALGFSLQVGNFCDGQPCMKLPDCSHDCRHVYEVNKVKKGGSTGTPWTASHDGVTAKVIVSLEWTSRAMVAMPGMTGTTGNPTPTGTAGMAGMPGMTQTPPAVDTRSATRSAGTR